jgi:hypothetical protein
MVSGKEGRRMATADEGNPPDEAARLAAFLGEWSVSGSLTAGDSPASVSGTWRFDQAADGWGVRGQMHTDIEGMGAFEEEELIGFDAEAKQVHMFSMNRYAVRDHVGGWVSDDTLLTRYSGRSDGTEVTEEISGEFVAPDRMVGRVVERADQAVVLTTDLIIQRQG